MTTETAVSHPKNKPVPPEVRGWNWGAFLLTWIWGLGNNTYIALLCFLPFVNFIMFFILGAKGNVWAWQNNYWEDVAHFKRVQRKWAYAGLILWGSFILLMVLFFSGLFGTLKSSDAYQITTNMVQHSPMVKSVLGAPITIERMTEGSLSVENGDKGNAHFTYYIEGPINEGLVKSQLVKERGQWEVTELVVEIPKTGQQLNLLNSNR